MPDEILKNRKNTEEFIFGSILLLANKFQVLGDSIIEEITMKQWFTLIMIKQIPKSNPTITEISEFTGTTRQNVKQMLTPLEKKGFVTVNKSEEDLRALSISLTAKCLKYFETHENSGDDLLKIIFNRIELDKLEDISKAFQILFENVDNFQVYKEKQNEEYS